jgi:hypothetical protein
MPLPSLTAHNTLRFHRVSVLPCGQCGTIDCYIKLALADSLKAAGCAGFGQLVLSPVQQWPILCLLAW